MIFAGGSGENHLALVCDMRTRADYESGDITSVVEGLYGPLGLTKAQWRQTLRLALWDWKYNPKTLSEPNAETVRALPEKKRKAATARLLAGQRRESRAEMRALLKARDIRCVLVLQTLSRQQEEHSLSGTTVWDEFGWEGTLYDSQGSINKDRDGYWVIPVLHPGNADWVYQWLTRRWGQWGLKTAAGQLGPIEWPRRMLTEPSEEAYGLLCQIATSPEVAIDIEAYTPAKLITSVGVASEYGAVSVPWDSFHTPDGSPEPGFSAYPWGEECAAQVLKMLAGTQTKIFHNYVFDVRELTARGYTVNAPLRDTMIEHQDLYRGFRHGLQVACATEFLVEPWKQLHTSTKFRKTDPDFWRERPLETRQYNCKDSYATWMLGQSLARRII